MNNPPKHRAKSELFDLVVSAIQAEWLECSLHCSNWRQPAEHHRAARDVSYPLDDLHLEILHMEAVRVDPSKSIASRSPA